MTTECKDHVKITSHMNQVTDKELKKLLEKCSVDQLHAEVDDDDDDNHYDYYWFW